jgi:hypothetical protein
MHMVHTDIYCHIPLETISYNVQRRRSGYMMLQDHCDVAVLWLYDSMGTYTISGILCYGTPRYGHLIQVVGFLRDFSHTEYKRVYQCIYIHLRVYLGICKFPPFPLRKPTT